MSKGLLGGIYIERERVRVVVASLEDEFINGPFSDPVVKARYQSTFEHGDDWDAGEEALALVVDALTPIAGELIGLGVGCYGPFVSLRRSGGYEEAGDRDESYGVVDEARADEPFQGQNLAATFEDGLQKATTGRRLPVLVQTDAAVAALGEAWYRNIGPDEMMAYLILDQGIGGGWVTGRQILSGALHPEAGLSSVTVHRLDPLRRDQRYRNATSVSGLCRLSAMLHRAEALGYDFDSVAAMLKEKDERLWTPFHNYVAQLCLTCTAVLSPSRIVLGGVLAKSWRCLPRVRSEFEQMWDKDERGPTLHHGALGDDAYISAPFAGRDVSSELAGTVYLAYKAAGYGSIKRLKRV